MTYFSPDYIKRRSSSGGGGSASEEAILEVIRNKVRVPYIEPVMAEDEIVLTLEGDIVMAQAGELPLIELP